MYLFKYLSLTAQFKIKFSDFQIEICITYSSHQCLKKTTSSTFGLRSTDFFFAFFNFVTLPEPIPPQFPQAPPSSGVDLVLQAKSLYKGHISFLYNLLSPFSDLTVNKSRADWEAELQMNFSDTLWEKALAAVNTSSSCARLTVTQFKVLFRLHSSKDKPFRLLWQMLPNPPATWLICSGHAPNWLITGKPFSNPFLTS